MAPSLGRSAGEGLERSCRLAALHELFRTEQEVRAGENIVLHLRSRTSAQSASVINSNDVSSSKVGGHRMSAEKWVSFDCFGTLIDWQTGFRRVLAAGAGGRVDELVEAYHKAEAD